MGPEPTPSPLLSRPNTHRLPADPDRPQDGGGSSGGGSKKRALVGPAATVAQGDAVLTPAEQRDQQCRHEEACGETETKPWSGQMPGEGKPLTDKERTRFAVLLGNIRSNTLDAYHTRAEALGVLTDILQDDAVPESTLLIDIVSAVLGAVSGGLLGVIAAKLVKPITTAVGQAMQQLVVSSVAAPSQSLIAAAMGGDDAVPTPAAFQDAQINLLDLQKNQWRNDWSAMENVFLEFPDRDALAEVEELENASHAAAEAPRVCSSRRRSGSGPTSNTRTTATKASSRSAFCGTARRA